MWWQLRAGQVMVRMGTWRLPAQALRGSRSLCIGAVPLEATILACESLERICVFNYIPRHPLLGSTEAFRCLVPAPGGRTISSRWRKGRSMHSLMRTAASLLMLLLIGLWAAPAPGQTITTVTIVEKAGVTTANYPVTLSLVFKKGDVASNVTARINGLNVNTQTDVKVRYPDNSVKHALVSFLIPCLAASSTAIVEITNGGTNYNTSYLTKTQLLATDFDARMAVTPSGGSTTTDHGPQPAERHCQRRSTGSRATSAASS